MFLISISGCILEFKIYGEASKPGQPAGNTRPEPSKQLPGAQCSDGRRWRSLSGALSGALSPAPRKCRPSGRALPGKAAGEEGVGRWRSDLASDAFENLVPVLRSIGRDPAALFPPNKITARCSGCGEVIRRFEGYRHNKIGDRRIYCRKCQLARGLPVREVVGEGRGFQG